MRSRLEWLAVAPAPLPPPGFAGDFPPEFSTSRRAPDRTGRVVSVCCGAPSARAVSVASVASIPQILLAPSAGEGVRPPQELQFAPHLLGEVQVQVSVAGVGRERALRLPNRAVDDG